LFVVLFWLLLVLTKQSRSAISARYDFTASRGRRSWVNSCFYILFGTVFKQMIQVREVAEMQNSFDSMQMALRSFGKFTPTSTVRDLLANRLEAGTILRWRLFFIKRQLTALGVTEIEATSFFSDIEGFTSISGCCCCLF
jgi:hypothetical protein